MEVASEESASAEGAPLEPASEAATDLHVELHDDPIAADFFQNPDRPVTDAWADLAAVRAMSPGSRRAMLAALGIFAVSLTAIAGFSAYHAWIMPVPVELTAGLDDQPASLPTPLPAASDSQAARRAAAPIVVLGSEFVVRGVVAPGNPAPGNAAGANLSGASAAGAHLAGASAPGANPSGASVSAGLKPPGVPADADAVLGSVHPGAGRVQPVPTSPTAQAEQLRAVRSVTVSPQPLAAGIGAPTKSRVDATAAAHSPAGGSPAADGSEQSPAVGAPSYAELVAVGQALNKKNRHAEATEAFRRALLRSPEGSAALSGLSFAYLNADQNRYAREYAERAIQADASNSEGWIVLGAALELLGDRKGAQTAYRQCVAQGRGPYLLECRRVAR